jgi:hypothetical protein
MPPSPTGPAEGRPDGKLRRGGGIGYSVGKCDNAKKLERFLYSDLCETAPAHGVGLPAAADDLTSGQLTTA